MLSRDNEEWIDGNVLSGGLSMKVLLGRFENKRIEQTNLPVFCRLFLLCFRKMLFKEHWIDDQNT